MNFKVSLYAPVLFFIALIFECCNSERGNHMEEAKKTIPINRDSALHKLISFEEKKDLSNTINFFSDTIVKYWNAKNISKKKLESMYSKSWLATRDVKITDIKITKESTDTFVVTNTFEFYSIKEEYTKQLKTNVTYVFNNDNKICATFGTAEEIQVSGECGVDIDEAEIEEESNTQSASGNSYSSNSNNNYQTSTTNKINQLNEQINGNRVKILSVDYLSEKHEEFFAGKVVELRFRIKLKYMQSGYLYRGFIRGSDLRSTVGATQLHDKPPYSGIGQTETGVYMEEGTITNIEGTETMKE